MTDPGGLNRFLAAHPELDELSERSESMLRHPSTHGRREAPPDEPPVGLLDRLLVAGALLLLVAIVVIPLLAWFS